MALVTSVFTNKGFSGGYYNENSGWYGGRVFQATGEEGTRLMIGPGGGEADDDPKFPIPLSICCLSLVGIEQVLIRCGSVAVPRRIFSNRMANDVTWRTLPISVYAKAARIEAT